MKGDQRKIAAALDDHVRRDPRILEVYSEARRIYGLGNRSHHNMDHVTRDLYRALLIAETEEQVDYGVLIPAVLLHDIGFCDPHLEELGHDAAGARAARPLLEACGYDEGAVSSICDCILSHKGRSAIPRTLEAKILYDADVLEKAGYFALVLAGKLMCEFGESLEECLVRERRDRGVELSRGYFTKQAKAIDGNRLARTRELYELLKREIEEERSDFLITEKDLWPESPRSGTERGNAAEEYLWAVRRSFQLGLQAGAGGNITIRLGPDRFITKPTGLALADCSAGDLVPVDAAGKVVEGSGRPTKEIRVHLALFRVRPDVRAIVHYHSPYATAYAVAGEVLPLPTVHARRILGRIGLVGEFPEGSDQLAAEVARAAADPEVRGLLMKGHGLITFGDSLQQAQYRAELMEESAQVAWLSRFVPGIAPESSV
jgi:L-ribulose-5-phosphate 4-epimerase